MDIFDILLFVIDIIIANVKLSYVWRGDTKYSSRGHLVVSCMLTGNMFVNILSCSNVLFTKLTGQPRKHDQSYSNRFASIFSFVIIMTHGLDAALFT